MSRQTEALDQVASRYEVWRRAQEHLHQEISRVSGASGPPPVAALQADFTAQRDLTRAAVAYARTCGPHGPDPDAIHGPAFAQALYQAATALDAEAELDAFDDAMAAWWPQLQDWTSTVGSPPRRPRCALHDRILDALTNWWEFLDDQANDRLMDSLAGEGAEVTRTFVRGPDGSVTTVMSARLDIGPGSDKGERWTPPPVGTLRRDTVALRHLAGLWRPPMQVLACGRDGYTRLLSAHWSGTRAYRHAHQARTDVPVHGWIELWEWTFRGFKLLDSLPWIDGSAVATNGDELVYGVLDRQGDIADIGVIGTISPLARGWSITVRDPGADTFWKPRFREWSYLTRTEAITAVEELFDRQSRG